MHKKLFPFFILFLFSGNIFADNYSLDFSSGTYAQIPMSESLSSFTNFTIEFWYYQTGFSGGDERIVGTEYASSSRYGVDNQHGDWSSYLYDGTNASSLDYWNPTDNTPSIIQNTWHHFAVTYDGNNSRFFLNGIMLKEEIASLSGFGDPNQDLVINRHTWASGSSSRLSGQLDELRISNVARYTSDFTPPNLRIYS